MRFEPARGAQARYERLLRIAISQRQRALTSLVALWVGDGSQLAQALERLAVAAPITVDEAQLLLVARAAQEQAARQAQALLLRAKVSVRRDQQEPQRPRSTITLTLWDQQPELRAAAQEWAALNVALIRGLDQRTQDRVAQAVAEAGEGTSLRELRALLITALGKSRRQAELIARDQVGKLASDTARYQMEQAGVTSYIWRAVGDERTRPEHRARDGEVFEWVAPPPGGHPGEAPLCRCYAEPIFDDEPA